MMSNIAGDILSSFKSLAVELVVVIQHIASDAQLMLTMQSPTTLNRGPSRLHGCRLLPQVPVS
jgi:hypothetical protein